MRLNSNSALFTLQRYNSTNTELNKTINKLSSGYKINAAADDAAGLSISEKMRGQIRGLNQAGENIQDGLSLIYTTESAIGQIQNPNLIRIRELIIQAANNTNTPEDRQLIQQEIDQLKRGIDDISNNTEFNSISTLIPEKLKEINHVATEKFDIVFLIDDSSTMQQDINMVVSGLSTFADKMKTVGDVQIASTSVVHSNRDLAATNDIEEVKKHLKEKHIATGGSTNPDQILSNLLTGSSNPLNLRADSKKIYVLLTDTKPEMNDLDNSLLAQQVQNAGAQVYVLGISNSPSKNETYFNNHFGEFATDILVPQSSEDISENLTPNLADTIIQNSNIEHIVQQDLIIQAGANEGQQIIIPLYDNRTTAIGIGNLDVTESYETTMEALRRVDIANKILSERRSTYGALSNRLEHAYNNVKNTEENLTKSESLLRDADMAKEMTKFQKDQVLLQSSQSMMAQINQMSQGILQLLG